MKKRPKSEPESGVAGKIHSAEQKVHDYVQVFFDASGKRKWIVNFLAPLIAISFFALIGFSSYYVYQIIQARDAVLSNQLAPKENTGISMFFTDNSPNSNPVLDDQLSNLDYLIMPRFQLTESGYITPETYEKWDEDVDEMGRYRTTHFKRAFVLSSRDYMIPPTERMEFSEAQNNLNLSLPGIMNAENTRKIIKDTKEAKGNSIYVELNLAATADEASAKTLADWLKAFDEELKKQKLELAIIYRADEVNELSRQVLAAAPRHYVNFSLTKTMGQQLDNLRAHDSMLPTSITYELPTVSTSQSLNEFNDYTESRTYASFQPRLLNQPKNERSIEAVTLTDSAAVDEVRDAVQANNFIRALTEASLLRKNTSYAIASPGYEEYTIWSLIQRPADIAYVKKELTDNLYASLSVGQQGTGYIYELSQTFSPGKREVTMDDKGVISVSNVLKPETQAKVQRVGEQPKKIALTFDDGPGSVGTREVLDVLDAYGVKGTFFLLGENVVANPAVAQEIVKRGHEVENHSYNHPKFGQISAESQISQISATSAVIKEITGVEPKYFRQPYSVDTSISTRSNIEYLDRLKSLGLLASEYGIDSKDWDVETADEAAERVISAVDKSEGKYSQILFHDNHKNVGVTLAALPIVITELQSRGIEFVRVDQLNSAEVAAMAPVSSETNTLRALKAKDITITTIVWVNICLIGISLMKYGWILIGMAIYTIKRVYRRYFVSMVKKKKKKRELPSFTAIIACYNEELVIERTLQSLVDCNYPGLKIIVVNDGSKDKTEEVVRRFAYHHKEIKLFTIPNGGKARALKYGIDKAKSEWLVFCDADTIFDKDALHNFAYSTMTDKYVSAVAGQVVVGNDINFITRAQVIEYGVAHIFIKAAQDVVNSVTVVPGAISLWSRNSLLSIGGFTPDTLAEDADATMRMITRGRTVRYWASVKAKTEAPATWKMHFKQRTRWQLGNMQAIFKHRRAFFNSYHRALGVIGIPFFYADLISALLYPILFVFAIFIMTVQFYNIAEFIPSGAHFIISPLFATYSLSMFAVEICFALVAILFKKRKFTSKIALLFTIPYYMTVYRFLLSYATLVAALRALRGTLQGWGHLKRTASVK